MAQVEGNDHYQLSEDVLQPEVFFFSFLQKSKRREEKKPRVRTLARSETCRITERPATIMETMVGMGEIMAEIIQLINPAVQITTKKG